MKGLTNGVKMYALGSSSKLYALGDRPIQFGHVNEVHLNFYQGKILILIIRLHSDFENEYRLGKLAILLGDWTKHGDTKFNADKYTSFRGGYVMAYTIPLTANKSYYEVAANKLYKTHAFRRRGNHVRHYKVRPFIGVKTTIEGNQDYRLSKFGFRKKNCKVYGRRVEFTIPE